MKKWAGLVCGLAVVAAAAGCATRGVRAEPPLAGSLQVAVAGDTARLTLSVTNVSGAPVVLRFRTGQRYDFEVRGRGGERMWRWSDQRTFVQALGEERLEAGATRQWQASWAAGGRWGSYLAVGRVTAVEHEVELEAAFEVGGE